LAALPDKFKLAPDNSNHLLLLRLPHCACSLIHDGLNSQLSQL
jgi:hypothetical protein